MLPPSENAGSSTPTSAMIQREHDKFLSKEDEKSCQDLLKDCDMFHLLSGSQIETLAKNMRVRSLQRNEVLVQQGNPVSSFYLLKDGDIHREFVDPGNGKRYTVDFEIKAKSINTMRILSGDNAANTVRCDQSTCKLYEMPRERLMKILVEEKPEIGVGIANSLTTYVQNCSMKYRTPSPYDKQLEIMKGLPSVMVAAGMESYYRSALNSQVNRVLTGVKGDLFPNMHIQVPTRVAYIAGFKGLRTYMERFEEEDEYLDVVNDDGTKSTVTITKGEFWKKVGLTIAPGVIMTPISSILEASNAGHMNKEPMATRWMRGITARCGREILFGLGLNQLSDYFQERFRYEDSPVLSNMVGSLVAGVVSGYLSHVPHNLSTYKLLEPHRSYPDLYKNVFVERSVPGILERYLTRKATREVVSVAGQLHGATPAVQYNGPQQAVRFMAATIFPKGLMVRTVQIVGSFIILNGTIQYFTLLQKRY